MKCRKRLADKDQCIAELRAEVARLRRRWEKLREWADQDPTGPPTCDGCRNLPGELLVEMCRIEKMELTNKKERQ